MQNRVKHHVVTLLASGFWLLSGFASASDERGLSRILEQPAALGSYRAVVIGNNDYKDPKRAWLPLKTAVNDAVEVANLLTKQYGFTEVNLVKNGSRRQILNALNDLLNTVKPADSVLVYYAGHGWRNEKTREAFWIPVDAEGRDDSFYLSNVQIKEKLSVLADVASHTLLISDSCFSGSLLDNRGARDFDPKDINTDYYAKVAKRKSVQILAAGGKEFVDDNYRGSGHSPFTYFLLNELKLNDQPHLTLANLALNIEQLVAKNTQQTPQSGAFREAGDEGGQFIFTRLGLPAPAPTPIMEPNPIPTPAPTPATVTSRPLPSGEFDDWKQTNPDNPKQLLAYITKYPSGSITDMAKLKYDSLMKTIDNLLREAAQDIKDKRLVEPAGRNAKERFLAVLKLDIDNLAARKGLDDVTNRLLQQADRQIDGRHFTEAETAIAQAELINPKHAAIPALREKLAQGKQKREEPAVKKDYGSSRFAPPPSF